MDAEMYVVLAMRWAWEAGLMHWFQLDSNDTTPPALARGTSIAGGLCCRQWMGTCASAADMDGRIFNAGADTWLEIY